MERMDSLKDRPMGSSKKYLWEGKPDSPTRKPRKIKVSSSKGVQIPQEEAKDPQKVIEIVHEELPSQSIETSI